MTDILFGQSYYLRFDPKLWQAMQPYPPLGTMYAASFLRSKGYTVALFDAMLAESEAEWAQALDRETPRVAVIYEDNFNYLSKMCLLRMRQAAFTMIAMARARGIPVIVGGSDATDHAEAYLQAGAEVVLLGEGELTLADVVAVLLGQDGGRRTEDAGRKIVAWQKLAQIQGLVFLTEATARQETSDKSQETRGQGAEIEDRRLKIDDSNSSTLYPLSSTITFIPPPQPALPDASNNLQSASSNLQLINTGRRADIKDLDALPFPAWDLIDVERYRAIWLERHGYFSMNMVTTRGCPYHCNWCAKPIWGQRYNVRSPQNVVAELSWLKQTYRPDHIWFADDIVGLKPGWMRRFGDLVQAAGAQVPFKCLSRADLLCREGEVAGLARAGCQIVWLGAESGAQQVLDAMEKGTRVEQIYRAAALLHTAGVRVGFFLQFGYPGETRADIERTLQMVRDCQPDDIGMSVSYPLPGTKFYQRVHEQLGTQHNWHDSNDLAMLYNGPYTTAFYRQLHTVLHREFRARKALAGLLGRGRRTADRRQETGDRRQETVGKREATHYPLPTTRFSTIYNLLITFSKNALALPLARWKLRRLERVPHQAMATLRPTLSHEAAATPSPQSES